jgi:hypothetical protein
VLSRVHWVRPELVPEVKYLTWTDDDLLRQVESRRHRKTAAQIPPRRTASGCVSGSARIRGRPARARHSIWCARSAASPSPRPPRVATSSPAFAPFSSQCRAGNLKIRRGSWNEELFRALEGFPEFAHDDEVDACSGAREMLSPNMKDWAKSSGCAERRKSSTRRSNLSRPRPYTPAAPWSGRPRRRRKERPKSRLARSSEPVARL